LAIENLFQIRNFGETRLEVFAGLEWDAEKVALVLRIENVPQRLKPRPFPGF
jgi:hypothetical protein